MLIAVQGQTRKGSIPRAFTLVEVVIAVVILAIVIQGVIYGYVYSAQRAEWSAHSLAAQSLAMQAVEQARAAKWDPQVIPPVDELPTPTNYFQWDTLDLPVSGKPILATNYVTIRDVSTNPPLREIQAQCVWQFMRRGFFTNTIVTLRASDQ